MCGFVDIMLTSDSEDFKLHLLALSAHQIRYLNPPAALKFDAQLRCACVEIRQRRFRALTDRPRKQEFHTTLYGSTRRRSVYDAPQVRTPHKQIEQQPNDVRTEFCGCLLKSKIFANQFF